MGMPDEAGQTVVPDGPRQMGEFANFHGFRYSIKKHAQSGLDRAGRWASRLVYTAGVGAAAGRVVHRASRHGHCGGEKLSVPSGERGKRGRSVAGATDELRRSIVPMPILLEWPR